MPIRMIAKELYQLEQKVEDLKRRIDNAPLSELDDLKDALRRICAERDHMRRVLEGNKEPPSYRKAR
jgi:hypothetical protein